MNISYYLYRIISCIKFRYFKYLFLYIQKPIWKLSYCGGGNYVNIEGLMLNCKLIINGYGNKIRIEKGCHVKNVNIKIDGFNNTIVIKSGASINESGRIIIEDRDNELIIGARTQIYSAFMTLRDVKTKLEIGQDCLLSSNVVIRTSDAHSIMDDAGKRINSGKDVIIGNHVWIGYNATILKGCYIGNNSVVGTHCVVSNQIVDNNTVIAGNPAKIVRSGVNWDIRRL